MEWISIKDRLPNEGYGCWDTEDGWEAGFVRSKKLNSYDI